MTLFLTFLRSPLARAALLGLLAFGWTWYVDHRARSAIRAEYVAATNAEHGRRMQVIINARNEADAAMAQARAATADRARLLATVNRLSKRNDSAPCLDAESVGRLDSVK